MKSFLARLRRRAPARPLAPPAWLIDAMARRLAGCAAYMPLAVYTHLYERLARASTPDAGAEGPPLPRHGTKPDG